jgi:transitional endoplasmic reticulum ATPase
VIPVPLCDLLAYASIQDDNVIATPRDPEEGIKHRIFAPPGRRYNDENNGIFLDRIVFGSFDYVFNGNKFILYVVEGAEDGVFSGKPSYNFLLLEDTKMAGKPFPQKLADELIRAATSWALELHDEVLVFDQGYWQKSAELWQNIQKSKWEDVILEQGKKDTIMKDVIGFFDSEKSYAEFSVPWKRGVIFYGPPGVSLRSCWVKWS